MTIFYRVPPNMEYVSFREGVVSNHQRHKRPPLFSGESHPNGIDPRFHYRCTCRWQPEPLTRLGHFSTTQLEAPNKCHKRPQCHQGYKPSRVPRTQEGQAPMSHTNQILRGEHKPMHQMQMARTPQRCSNPSLPNSTKATKDYGGIREEEQWRKSTKDSKI